MGAGQSTMTQSFDTLAKEFYSNPQQVIAVENYEMNDEPMILPDGSTVHGTVGDGPKKGIPAFGFLKFPDRKDGGTCIPARENDNVFVVLRMDNVRCNHTSQKSVSPVCQAFGTFSLLLRILLILMQLH